MTPVQPACPRCGAHSRVGAQWCTLCYADLRPAPPVAAPDLSAQRVEALVGGTTPAGRGKHARTPTSYAEADPAPEHGADSADSADGAEGLGTEAMLALLAAESSRPLRGISARFDSSGSRAGLMAGGVVLISALLFLVMAIIGSLI